MNRSRPARFPDVLLGDGVALLLLIKLKSEVLISQRPERVREGNTETANEVKPSDDAAKRDEKSKLKEKN